MTDRPNRLRFVIVPESPDAFVVVADPGGGALPDDGMVVIPTILSETYWMTLPGVLVGAT